MPAFRRLSRIGVLIRGRCPPNNYEVRPGAGLHAAETTYGAGVKLAAATPVKDLCTSPGKFVGKTVCVDGVVTSVCTETGCWLAIA